MLKLGWYITVATTAAVFLGSFGDHCSDYGHECVLQVAKLHLSYHTLRHLRVRRIQSDFSYRTECHGVIYTAIKQDKKNWEQMTSKLEQEHDVSQPALNNTLCRRFRFIIHIYSLQKLCSVWVSEIQLWQYYRDGTETAVDKTHHYYCIATKALAHPYVQCPGKKRFCNSWNKVHILLKESFKKLRNQAIQLSQQNATLVLLQNTECQAYSSLHMVFLKKAALIFNELFKMRNVMLKSVV